MILNSLWTARRAGLVSFALILCLAACTTRVTQTGNFVPPADQAAGVMPRPQRLLVSDFEVDPNAVKLDQGIGPRLLRTLNADPTQATPAADVQSAITEALIDDLRKMGFVVERAWPGMPVKANDLLVQGQIVKIDEGNRTRRMTIGFGAGKSSVEATVQVYYSRGEAQPALLQTYNADANSGRKPGMGVGAVSAAGARTVEPAALSAGIGVHGEKSGVAGEGQHLADRIAYNLGEFFVQRGWIPASAAPSSSLL